ncbi:MAG: cation diffusion facilitator family transporter [Gammaproteobacteria bacterium]|nr:cation diffusion facilitator family transporter [Gammaproteobacteria bacterium]
MSEALPRNTLDLRYREVRKVTLVGSVVDLALGVVKILVGVTAQSQALIADGVHSLSDLGTDFMVLYAAKHAHREADAEHPYGHGRIETVTTVALGVALTAVAIGITWDAVRRLLDPALLLHPGWLALVVAFVSVVAKEAIYHYTARAGRRLRSNMLLANAWHSRSDAISSIVVVIGIAGVMAGLPYLDAIAAVAVALMIAKIGWSLLWKGLQELIDTSLETDRVNAIRQTILGVSGVRALHMLRTRRSGSDALVDVHILVDPALSVSEGHQIGESVRARLVAGDDDVADVTVHIDPEDDELASPCTHLPLRDEILRRLDAQWDALQPRPAISRVVLHYLDGRVNVDVFVSMETGRSGDMQARAQQIIEAAGSAKDIGEVRVYYQATSAP